jgi:hypothetical protein
MTEKEWLKSDDPTAMLKFLHLKTSNRKLRLFSVLCCRRIWQLLTDDRSREAVNVAELFADGMVSEQEVETAGAEAHTAMRESVLARQAGGYTVPEMYTHSVRAAWFTTIPEEFIDVEAALAIVSANSLIARDLSSPLGSRESEKAVCSSTLRDIFGNPFRPVAFDPSWRTSTAVALASQMYESRDFAAMPILADALQDAGCDSADILDHCRGAGPHVRGCWVVDLVLGKG